MKKKYIYYFIRFSLWILLFVIGLELFIRNLIIKYPPQNKIDGLGNVPIENSNMVWGLEGYGVTNFLSNGEITTPYDYGVSVMVLGDSFTEGLQVNDNQKYVSVAEEILHSRNLEVNMHNLGASGRSVADYVYIAPFIIDTYAPEVMIIQCSLTDFNESFNSSRENYFYKQEESLKLIHNEKEYIGDQRIRNYLRLSGLIGLLRYKVQPLIEAQINKLNLFNFNVVEENNSPFNQDAPKVDQRTENIQKQIHALEDAYPNITLVFIIIPNIPSIQEGDLIWENQNDTFLLETLKQFNIPHVIYPKEYFQKLYVENNKFPRGFFNTLPNYGHLNSDGNYILGQALADYLENILK